MAELVVIGHPDETTAQRAFDTAVVLQRELILEFASVATVSRREEGRLNLVTPTGRRPPAPRAGRCGGGLIVDLPPAAQGRRNA